MMVLCFEKICILNHQNKAYIETLGGPKNGFIALPFYFNEYVTDCLPRPSERVSLMNEAIVITCAWNLTIVFTPRRNSRFPSRRRASISTNTFPLSFFFSSTSDVRYKAKSCGCLSRDEISFPKKFINREKPICVVGGIASLLSLCFVHLCVRRTFSCSRLWGELYVE